MTASHVESRSRIPSVDIMKGIGMMLVIHTHAFFFYPQQQMTFDIIMSNVTMPLFFYIAGFFIPTRGGFRHFLTQKINRLLIPFAFFFVLQFVFYLSISICENLIHGQKLVNTVYVLDLPSKITNGVLWFLRSLFCGSVLFYGFLKLMSRFNVYAISIITIVTCYIGVHLPSFLSNHFGDSIILDVIHFTRISFALEMFPFMWIGHLSMKHHFSSFHITWARLLLGCIILTLILCVPTIIMQCGDGLPISHEARILKIVAGLAGIGLIRMVSKFISKHFSKSYPVLYLKYIGRYSLIAYGTHCMLLKICESLGSNFPKLNFCFALVMCPIVINMCIKYIPLFTAQQIIRLPSLTHSIFKSTDRSITD